MIILAVLNICKKKKKKLQRIESTSDILVNEQIFQVPSILVKSLRTAQLRSLTLSQNLQPRQYNNVTEKYIDLMILN